MSHLQDDFGRLRADDADGHAHLDAIRRILHLPAVQQVVAGLGRAPGTCPVIDDPFALLFVLALGLFPAASYRDVARRLVPAEQAGRLPSRAALAAARRRLGAAPLRALVQHGLPPLAGDGAPDAFREGLRLLTLDGLSLAVPDSPGNAAVFGRHANRHGASGDPAVRVVALMEAATHAVLDCEPDAGTARETVMAAPLLGRLPGGCLLLWDRHSFSSDHLGRVARRGSHVPGRLSKSVKPKLVRRLPDGSYLAEVRSGHRSRFGTRGRLPVRLLPYRLDDPGRGDTAQTHRLVTTLPDEQAHPARERIVLYHERREQELAHDEVKTHQLGRPVLRSRTPEGVEQEVAALLLAHRAVRRVMAEADEEAGVPPRRISFVAALEVVRCRLPGAAAARRRPGRLRRWYAALGAEVSREVLPPRRQRVNPRVVKCARVKWPGQKTVKARPLQPDKPFGEVIALGELSI